MKDKVWNYMQEFQMTVPGDRIVLGVSGGGDSMALLHVLSALRKKGGYELAVVHVNHGIRGQEALEDQQFVENVCQSMEIPCRSIFCRVKELAARKGLSEEEAGREARREAMEAYCTQWGGTKIAMAHHRDDLAETVLHHLARGCGLRGLSGIQPVNGRVIHPFLCINRKEIEQYLEENQIVCRTDSTNLTDAYTRNKIRHHLLPFLTEQINGRAVEHIASAAFLAGEADAFLREQGEIHLRQNSERVSGGLFLPQAFFQGPHIVKLYALARAAEDLAAGKRDLTRKQMEGILQLAEKPVGKQLPFYQGIYGIRRYDGVLLTKELRSGKGAEENAPVQLCVPGVTEIANGRFFCRIFPYTGQDIAEKKYTKWLDYDKISKNLTVRRRMQGDYITVTKEGGRKKLKDFYINEKIPRDDRGNVWLIASGPEVLWAVGVRLGETCKISKETRTVLEIIYQGGTWNE